MLQNPAGGIRMAKLPTAGHLGLKPQATFPPWSARILSGNPHFYPKIHRQINPRLISDFLSFGASIMLTSRGFHEI
jgi:hypothetical protein